MATKAKGGKDRAGRRPPARDPGTPVAGAFAAERFEIFLSVAPGLESVLCAEVNEKGFGPATAEPGGVTITGTWGDVFRANLEIRGASHVLARLDTFRVDHLAKLDRHARQLPWAKVLRRDIPVWVEATCRRSRIYHSGAAAERIARAIGDALGVPATKEAGVVVKARLDHDVCTIAIDTSGEPLHRRGHKQAVSKAPMRETLASLFLRQCGYRATETVVDPMCGSGTFVIEAAEIAAGLNPGRSRHFAFEELAVFDAAAWGRLKSAPRSFPARAITVFGSDRDAGAIRMSRENADRAGVAGLCTFTQADVSDLVPPEGPPGLVIVNPPYGTRIGEARRLAPLYQGLGRALKLRFTGWRLGLIATDEALVRATGLRFRPPGETILHGGLRIRLFQSGPL